MPRIDAHLHTFPLPSAEFPREVSTLAPAEREEPVEKLLEAMETSNIDQAMLVQMGGEEVEHHAYLRYCFKTYPQRFLGIGLIPEDCPDPETHMDRIAATEEFIGFRLGSLGGPQDPFAPVDVRQLSAYRIWQHAAKRDYVLWLYVQASDAYLTAYLIEAFPQVRVVFNHLGVCPGKGKFSVDEYARPHVDTPWYNPAFHSIYRLSRYENVTVLLSGQYAFAKEGYPYNDLVSWHRSLYNAYGAERLLWATDAPWIYEEPGYAQLTTVMETLLPDLNAGEYADIMGGTAQRFLRFPPISHR